MTKSCRLCKTKFVGRSDKIFCTVACKSLYHRKLNSVTKQATSKVDNILHRNRSILLEVMGKNNFTNKKIPKIRLDNTNYKYSFVTGYYINTKGKMINYVYDFYWFVFSDAYLIIGRNKDNLII